MTQVNAAVVSEQGVRFTVVGVKKYVVNSQFESIRTMNALFPEFNMPIVLCAIDNMGRAHYRGRRDIVNWLINIDLRQLPWRQYTLN